MLETIDTLIKHERYREAEEALAGIATPAAEVMRMRLRLVRGGMAVDDVVLELEALIAGGELADDDLARAFEIVAASYVQKRLPGLARDAVARGRERAGDRPGLTAMEAEIALVEDDRPAARAGYEKALAMDAALGVARLGMGRLLYVMADFAAAESELSRVPVESRHWGAAARVRAAVAGARGEHEREAEVWRELLERRPDGDGAQSDRIGLGLCLTALGRRQEATEAFRAAWQLAPDSGNGRYARERMTHLEAAPEATRRVELKAFPTTAQKWNYCGPAVLELVLRYFDFTADQDTIAGIVKREHGTPMFEIVAYLGQMGVEARRIEAGAPQIKKAIDLGCPVIVQEEYSTSSHVAVITGYDDLLGTFVAQDPMRHQPMLKSFTFTEAAGDLFGNGAIVVLGPESVAAGRRAACDEAGLVERRHLALVDECSRRRRSLHAEGHEDLAPGEVIRFCDQALALAPNFKLARYLRFHALRRLAQAGSVDHDHVLRDLALLRIRYPGDEWPYQLHGSMLQERGLYDECFAAYLDAHRRDTHDEANLQGMGEARWLAGDLVSAEKYLLAALTEGPDCTRAAENLAAVYLRSLEETGLPEAEEAFDEEDHDTIKDEEVDDGEGDDDDEDEEDDPAPARMAPARLRNHLGTEPAEVARRARHFSRVALAASQGNPFNHVVAGELARLAGEHEQAAAAFRRALEIDPGRHRARHSLIEALEALGDDAAAEREIADLVRRSPDNAESHLLMARFLRARDRDQEAASALRAAVDRVTVDRERLVEPLYSVLEDEATGEAAAAQLRDLAERYLGDDDFLRRVVTTLDNEGQRGHALALARHLAERAPGDPWAIWQLAHLLDDSGVHRGEARELFQRLIQLAPDVAVARVRLAWLLLDDDPAAALATVEPVVASEDSDVYDAQSACLEALGQSAAADRALARALQAAPSPDIGLAMLINRHCIADRYERAYQLARKVDLAAIEDDGSGARAFVESVWLTAHRLSGHARDVIEQVRELCASGVAEHLAFEIYYSYRQVDRELAARAADVRARNQDDPADRAEWNVIALGLRAKQSGDPKKLDAMAKKMPPHASAWAELSYSYMRLERYGDADQAAARAFELDPLANDAFTAWIEALERQNQIDKAIACAESFAAARPYEHQGPERLGIILAKTGRVEDALAQSARAMEAAPYCHVSQQSRALALFMAGDHDGALAYARRSAGNEPPAPDTDGSSDDELLIAALTGDVGAVDRGLAALDRSEPGVYPLYRARLVEVAASRAARGG
jgi:tetratricopeptide (TPR) repeat protein